MNILLFNINGIKDSMDALNNILEDENSPDILGLNEIKCAPKTLEKYKLAFSTKVKSKYNIIWNPAKKISYHGTAMFINKK